jgi:hypothetical protein
VIAESIGFVLCFATFPPSTLQRLGARPDAKNLRRSRAERGLPSKSPRTGSVVAGRPLHLSADKRRATIDRISRTRAFLLQQRFPLWRPIQRETDRICAAGSEPACSPTSQVTATWGSWVVIVFCAASSSVPADCFLVQRHGGRACGSTAAAASRSRGCCRRLGR